MGFEYTDKQLNSLNWDEGVYSVNSDFVDRKGTKQLVEEPKGVNQTNIYKAADGQKFQVVATCVDPETGFDGMAVAPFIKGKPDFSQVAIVAAGTDPDSRVNKFGPISRDFLNAMIGDFDLSKSNGYNLSHQYKPAEAFVKKIMDDPRYTVVQLSGYSQGAYMLKVGAKYGIPTTTFNSWFMYGTLTSDEANFIKKHPWMFRDYRKDKDYVVWANDFDNPYIWGYDDNFDTIRWIKGFFHDKDGWDFGTKHDMVIDKEGNSLFEYIPRYIIASMRQMAQFDKLKSKWESSGSVLSSSEKIFLDAIQGEILSTSMVEAAETGETEVSQLRDKANQEIEDIWSKIDFDSYTELTPFEVQTAFMNGGITYDKFVGGLSVLYESSRF